MSSVFAHLSRFDAPVDGASPSAEDEFLTAQGSEPATDDTDGGGEEELDLVGMLNYVGGSYFLNKEGFTEIALSKRAADRLSPWQTVQIYRDAEGVPVEFWEAVYTAYLAMRTEHEAKSLPRKERRKKPCRICKGNEATHTYGGVPRAVCDWCLLLFGSTHRLIVGPVRLACIRCGVGCSPKATMLQEAAFGRDLHLCEGCFSHRKVEIDRQGNVRW